MKASSIPPKTLIASSMIQQRLLPEAGGAGVEERLAWSAHAEFNSRGAALALLAFFHDPFKRNDRQGFSTHIARFIRKLKSMSRPPLFDQLGLLRKECCHY